MAKGKPKQPSEKKPLPVITMAIYPFEVKMAVSPLVTPNSEQDILIFRFQTLPLFTMEAQGYGPS